MPKKSVKASKPATEKKTTKKAKKKGDLPGQKVMKHGPKKIDELEAAGARYADAVAKLDAAKDDVITAEGIIFDIEKKKRVKAYTVAGYCFKRVSGGEKLSVTTASSK